MTVETDADAWPRVPGKLVFDPLQAECLIRATGQAEVGCSNAREAVSEQEGLIRQSNTVL